MMTHIEGIYVGGVLLSGLIRKQHVVLLTGRLEWGARSLKSGILVLLPTQHNFRLNVLYQKQTLRNNPLTLQHPLCL